MKKAAKEIAVFTIGHSTRPLQEFIALLKEHQISLVVDIRTIPRSRHNPQYEQEAFRKELQEAGIEYLHLKRLGGLRHARIDSPNAGWKNASFRGFADYMQTEGFQEGLAELIGLAREKRTALMCAEAVPWRCHRSLISDALLARGIQVEHITGRSHAQPHRPTPFARIEGLRITYPDPVP